MFTFSEGGIRTISFSSSIGLPSRCSSLQEHAGSPVQQLHCTSTKSACFTGRCFDEEVERKSERNPVYLKDFLLHFLGIERPVELTPTYYWSRS